jgi:hypothetical protein
VCRMSIRFARRVGCRVNALATSKAMSLRLRPAPAHGPGQTLAQPQEEEAALPTWRSLSWLSAEPADEFFGDERLVRRDLQIRRKEGSRSRVRNAPRPLRMQSSPGRYQMDRGSLLAIEVLPEQARSGKTRCNGGPSPFRKRRVQPTEVDRRDLQERSRFGQTRPSRLTGTSNEPAPFQNSEHARITSSSASRSPSGTANAHPGPRAK